MNRLDWSGSSGSSARFGAGFLLMGKPYQPSDQSSRLKTKANCGSGNGNRAQTRQCRVFSFGDRLRVSRFVGEALAPEAFQRSLGTRHVVYAQPFAVAVAEVEFGQIPMQVGFADMEVAAGDTPLENAEIVLDGVGVSLAAHVLVGAMVDAFVLEVSPHMVVLTSFVSVQIGLAVNLGHQHRPKTFGCDARNAHRTNASISLHQREHGHLANSATASLQLLVGVFVLFLATDIGFVGLYCLAIAAQGIKRSVLHRFADAMGKEPRSLHATLEHSLDLAGCDALLAGTHQMDHLQPQVQRQVRRLEDSSNPNRKRLPASVALVQALAGGFAVQLADMLVCRSTERTVWAIWPKVFFDVRESRILIVEMGG